jgi:alginate O-acetyltransferase complex protein AlgI
MQFQSYVFIFGFLPIVFLLYSLTRTTVLSKWVIVVSSVIFYGWEEPWFVLPMAATGLVD